MGKKDKECTDLEIRWWHTYCQTALFLGGLSDSLRLRLLNVRMDNKLGAAELLGKVLDKMGSVKIGKEE